jgi:hypothetical protein
MRKSILYVFVVLVIAFTLRYLVPVRFGRFGRFGLSFRSGGVIRGVPINLLAFWLVLAIGGIVILIKLIAGRGHR